LLKIKSWESVPSNYTGSVEYENGMIVHLENGQFHRENAPAIEYPDGVTEWRVHNNLHREDGPAIDDVNSPEDSAYWVNNLYYSAKDYWALPRINGELVTQLEYDIYKDLDENYI
jgi:hypothetical protein